MPAPVSTGVMSTSSSRRIMSTAVLQINADRNRPNVDRRAFARRRIRSNPCASSVTAISRSARRMTDAAKRLAAKRQQQQHGDPDAGAGRPCATSSVAQADPDVNAGEIESGEEHHEHDDREREPAHGAHRGVGNGLDVEALALDRCGAAGG